MKKRLTESTIAECQVKFNLSYHVTFAYWCQQLVGFPGKDVLEVGGSLPKDFVFDYLNVKSWSAVESPDYETFIRKIGKREQGSQLTDINDFQNFPFKDGKLEKYNLFLSNIEDLPSQYYRKYDLVFSIAAFEHIHKFPVALEKMFLSLKPSGKLFTCFSPIWSAPDGHHLPMVIDKNGKAFDFHNSPIPPWGHLLMRPPELCRYLYQFTDKETADLIVYHVYNSLHINRFFVEDYIDFINQSSFSVNKIELIFPCKIDNKIQETLESIYPGRTQFANDGILAILERPLEAEDFQGWVLNKIDIYSRNLDKSGLNQVRNIRKQIANFFLITEEEVLNNIYLSDIGKAHQNLLNCSLKDEPLREDETIFLNELVLQVSQGLSAPKAIQYLLAAMLYRRAHKLPLQHELTSIPQWLLSDYLKFLFNVPSLFQEDGEVESYYQYIRQWLDYLHGNIFGNIQSEFWQHIALNFNQTNFIPLYFSTANLRDIYTKRGDILEYALKISGNQIDYDFPERAINREKIRLGILNAHFNPQTETFLTIPAFEYLDREKFEIILYAIIVNGHPLEQYCQSRADRLVQLPDRLPSQVETIRADDLDILLLGTNVTAVTNAISLLALHRLAPIQATLYSSPVTTGMRNIDYYISGKLTEPVEGSQDYYRERLMTLDGTGYCFNYHIEPEPSEPKPDRKKLGLSEQAVVFISGANFYKIIPELRETWAKIIAAVPDSVLVLYPFSPSWSSSYAASAFINNMQDILAENNVEKERLIILESIPIRADVKEYLKLADVYLDSFPYTGSFSTSDPLEVGIPPVVMDGNTLRSRQGPALLRELQIYDLIADREESYIQIAIALGTNAELRKGYSNRIKQAMQGNPGFLDSRSYSAKIGTLLQQLFHNHLADALSNKFRLREINLIIFPDWSQPEDSLSQDLASVIKAIVAYPDKSYVTLLIDISDTAEEEAELVLSSVVMNLLMEEDLDISDEIGISLVGKLSELQRKVLLFRISGHLILENENQKAIALFQADTIACYELDTLPEMRFL